MGSRLAGWLRPFESSRVAPAWVGLSIAAGYLLLHALFDAVWLALLGFPANETPLWRSEQWTDLVNAALIGYLLAAQAILRRGAARDLHELRPRLPHGDAEFAAIVRAASGPGGSVARGLALGGVALGAWVTFADPSISNHAQVSPQDPIFVWALARSMLFLGLLARFTVDDFAKTRTYMRIGRRSLRVDLLDVGALAPFLRRGQRSALAWVLFSTLFSLFWLGESAARGNLLLLLVVLAMAAFAFFGPLLALRQNIGDAKRRELARLRDEIRDARSQTDPGDPGPRLANTIAWYQLVASAREWPVDAANLIRFAGYLLLGLGSWLGGAIVERLLDTALSR